MLRPIDRKGESVARSVLLSSVSCVCECGVGYSVSVTVHGDLLARDVTGHGNRNASRYVRLCSCVERDKLYRLFKRIAESCP